MMSSVYVFVPPRLLFLAEPANAIVQAGLATGGYEAKHLNRGYGTLLEPNVATDDDDSGDDDDDDDDVYDVEDDG